MFLFPSLQGTHIRLIGPRKYGVFRDLHHPMPYALSIISYMQYDVFRAIPPCVHGRSMVVSGLQSSHSYSHPSPTYITCAVAHGSSQLCTWCLPFLDLFTSVYTCAFPYRRHSPVLPIEGLLNSKTRKCQTKLP